MNKISAVIQIRLKNMHYWLV